MNYETPTNPSIVQRQLVSFVHLNQESLVHDSDRLMSDMIVMSVEYLYPVYPSACNIHPFEMRHHDCGRVRS